MSNVVEFILKLKDMMSGGMRNVATSTQSSLSRVQSNIGRTTQSIDSMNRRLDALRTTRELSVDTRQIRAAGREMERLERQRDRLEGSGRSSGKGGGGILGMLGLGGGASMAAGVGLAALVAGGGYSIGQALKGSQQKASFEVLGGKQQGGQLYSDITKFAQDSIFGNELYKNAQTLLSFGTDVKKVLPDLKMLGDISMGDAEKLGSLTLAFSQVQSAGRLTGRDLLQFINTGFNPLKEISDMTRQSMATLKKRMEDGAISSQAISSAFEHATGSGGKFFQMTEKIADTPFGKWEALKGQVQGIALQFGTALLPAVSKVLGILPPLLESITPLLQKLVPLFSSIANIATTLLVPALKVVGAYLNIILDIITPVLKGVEWVINKVFGTFDDGRIEEAYADAGEMSGKAYVGGIAEQVKDVKTVVGKSVKAPGMTDAWKEAAGQHSKTYMDALKENMQTWDLTVPVKLEMMPNIGGKSGLSDFVVNPDGSLGYAPAAKVDHPDTQRTKDLFNAAFRTGNYKPDPNGKITLGGDWGMPAMAKKQVMKHPSMRLDPAFFNGSNSYAGIAPGWLVENFKDTDIASSTKGGTTNLDKLLGGTDSSSKALQTGGMRSIVFNIDTVGVKGGMTIQSQNVTEGAEELQHIVIEAVNRVLDGVSAPMTH